MCTLIVLDRIVPECPIVVGSNRDEYLARPSSPPTRIAPDDPSAPAFVAPQDLEAGGSWMGVNAHGLFVGLTNRRSDDLRSGRRSRGLLVQDALGCTSAREVHEALGELHGVYNPCHLFFGDGKEAFLAVVSDDLAETRVLEPGRHVICNRDPDDASSDKTSRISRAVGEIEIDTGTGRLMGALSEILRDHSAGSPLENTCVHSDGYGTRSSTLLALGESRWQGWHAEGPPCEAKYRNCTRLLEGLR